MSAQLEDRNATIKDHELRIRLNEVGLSMLTSGNNQSKTSLDSTMQLGALALSTVAIILSVIWHAAVHT